MSDFLTAIALDPNRPLQAQITEYVRQRILSGALPDGAKLPSIHEAARAWDTNYFTVHKAFAALAKEGLLAQYPKRGTFVRHHVGRLETLGIYLNRQHWPDNDGLFYSIMLSTLINQMQKLGGRCIVWAEDRPEDQWHKPLPGIVEAVRANAIDALVAPQVDRKIVRWLSGLKVPTAFLTPLPEPGAVYFDQHQMLRTVLARFQELDCRTVGMLSHIPRLPGKQDAADPIDALYTQFQSAAAEFGLKTSAAWCIGPPTYAAGFERTGYELFQRFWRLKKRPQGLFVMPDVVARGVLRAAGELHARIPSDVRLICHKNAEVELFSTVPVDWITASATEATVALLAQIRRKVAGQPAEPVCLPFVLQVQEKRAL